MAKILYFDVETTGISSFRNDIIQFAGILEIDDEVVEKVDIKMQPFSYDNITAESLQITGNTIESLKKLQKPEDAYKEIVSVFGKHIDKFDKQDKFYPAGYNLEFDLSFMNQFFKKNGDNYFGSFCNWKRIDALPMLHIMDLRNEIRLMDYKLGTVADHFGIEINAHDALSDIEATREIIKKLLKKRLDK